jgi:hypothetical protein
LLNNIIKDNKKYIELDLIIKDAFKSGKVKHLKYFKLIVKNAILFIAYIFNLYYKASIITIIILNQRNELFTIVKNYIIIE